MNQVDLRLYGIIDPERTAGHDPVDVVRQAVAGGVTIIQYRDKQADGRRQVELARVLKTALEGSGVPLLINDRVDVALAAGADGVHLGQDDMHTEDARRLLGPQAIIGVTVKMAAHADELARLPVNYSCVGGVFATLSKTNPSAPIGLAGLSEIARRVRVRSAAPIGAISGINASNAGSVIAAGVDGVAVISALFMAADPQGEARRLRGLVDHALAARGALA
jgi:thiamine-phosphate pyrophosphorylase